MASPRASLWTRIDFAIVANVLGAFAIMFSFTMLLPLLIGWWRDERFVTADRDTMSGILWSASLSLLIGFALRAYGRRSQGEFYRREGILTVALVWLLVSAMGALPFWLSGVLSLSDAFFESVSGLTTTGSSILGSDVTPTIQSMPPSLLFWRSWLHWLGGLGIVVMFLAFLPALGITEKTLFQAEVAGVSKEGLRPRIRQSTLMLLKIYVAISGLLFLGYYLLGMNVFEALCHSFATIATGGFSTKNYSVGEFGSVGIELLATGGMIFAAVNFGLYHRFFAQFKPMFAERWWWPRWSKRPAFSQAFGVFYRDPEFRFFAGILICAVVLITVVLGLSGDTIAAADDITRDYAGSWGRCARDASFQVTSISSSTGFANSNLLRWPQLAQALIIVLMLIGGCSGSTSGGIKVARVLILLKLIARNLRLFIRPRAIEPLRIGKDTLDTETADRVVALTACWFVILIVGSLLLMVLEPRLDLIGSATSMITSLCNIGPAFVAVDASGASYGNAIDIGSFGSFGEFSASAKTCMAFGMILGRLEVYTALILLTPGFWKD